MKGYQVLRLSLMVIQLLAFSALSKAETGAATIKAMEIEEVQGETYFKLSIQWPAETGFQSLQTHRYRRGFLSDSDWRIDELALVSQDEGAFRVVRQNLDQSWSYRDAPIDFIGKLKNKGLVKFVLRYPTPKGSIAYLPVDADFGKAKKGKGLHAAWINSQVNFLQRFPLPPDFSFAGYAAERLNIRLGNQRGRRDRWSGRWGRPNLYEITTGALAMQESLQIERLRNENPPDLTLRTVAINSVKGVTVSPLPWDQMLGGKKPEIDSLAALIPEDQYYVRFHSVKRMKTFLDFAEQWGGWMLSEVELGGRDYGSREKIENQICLKTSWISDLLGEQVIENIAVTGTDPYIREGSDLTLIFQLKSDLLFMAATGRYIDEARKNRTDLKESTATYEGVTIESYVTPDSSVRLHRAKIGDYRAYSNSPVAIRRVIDAFKGKRASMAKAKDYAYIRSLYPVSAPEEDGFIFLSDSFLRALTGPRLRIAEKRRIETLTTLELVKNAALFYLWEHPGAPVPTLDELVAAKALDKKLLVTEPGDEITWDPAAFQAKSKRYGRMGHLTPNIELAVDTITKREKNDYDRFRENYQHYWRRYFDPIGIRITARDQIALAVTILPLIDESEYNRLKEAIGGKSIEIEPLRRGGPVVLHLSSHINPDYPELKRLQTLAFNILPNQGSISVDWIGERVEFWIEDWEKLNRVHWEASDRQVLSEALLTPMVFGIEIKNPFGMAAFLLVLKSMVEKSAPNMLAFEQTIPYHDFVFTKVRPTAQALSEEENPSLANLALYYGAVGKMLFISTSLPALQRVVDEVLVKNQVGATGVQRAGEIYGAANTGHLAIRANLKEANASRALLDRLLMEKAVDAEQQHLRALWLVAQVAGLGAAATITPEKALGYTIKSALGNNYRYDPAKDEVLGSLTGSVFDLKASTPVPKDSPLKKLLQAIDTIRGTLEFTKEGLHTELSIRRAGK